jgi:hypothetical protein
MPAIGTEFYGNIFYYFMALKIGWFNKTKMNPMFKSCFFPVSAPSDKTSEENKGLYYKHIMIVIDTASIVSK